ncbi:helix-turn-helix domain-containing protein [Pseudomonas sp. CGJS7]|uniref:helix-turn-helix domain-containing protein n=1 Tax=Pseudomonas sp. CGJS7 TaxID=3109348 RepID=UPI003FA76C16
MRKLREKLGLSRETFAPLLGASAQTVYNREQQGTRPRPEIIEKIAILRGMSKREVLAVLDQHNSPPAKSTKRTPTKYTQKRPKKTAKPARRSRPVSLRMQLRPLNVTASPAVSIRETAPD